MACGHWDVKRYRVFPPVCFALYAKVSSLLSRIYLIILSLSCIFSCLVIFAGVTNYFDGRPDLTAGRIIIGSLLLSYTWANIYVLKNKGFYLHKFVLFSPMYLAFGLYANFFHRGYIKNWAPSTTAAATDATVSFVIEFGVIFLAYGFVTFFTGNRAKNA